MQRMLLTTLAVLLYLHTSRIITSVLLGRIVSFLADCTFQPDHRPYTFFRHNLNSWLPKAYHDTPILLQDFCDTSSTDCQAAFADGEG